MDKSEIYFGDWQQLLLGNAPLLFLLEVMVRASVMYVSLLLVLRLLGKRMNGQITIVELAVMISLGGIIALPMQAPDRGILAGILLLFLILLFHRSINALSFFSKTAEESIQGKVSLLVKDGLIQIDEMSRSGITRDQLFARLRSKQIDHLGQVQRVYQEACGLFSIFLARSPCPGLSILPEKDPLLIDSQEEETASCVCGYCGFVTERQNNAEPCQICRHKEWTKAVREQIDEA